MFRINHIMSFFFAKIAFILLCLFRWKRRAVYANVRYTSNATVSNRDLKKFYKRLLWNLTRHVGELIFCFSTFKKLPHEISSYPCHVDGWNFSLAKTSIPALKKMRSGGIFLTAHYGNYEAIGTWVCRLGSPLVASYIPLKPKWLNDFVKNKIRTVDGRGYSIAAKTPRDFLQLLDEKNLFCLLADQDSRISSAKEGIFMKQVVKNNPLPDFLQKHRPKTPVFVCWMEELGKNRVLHAEELVGETNILNMYNAWLEKRIMEEPTLWYGFTHRRFLSANPKIYI